MKNNKQRGFTLVELLVVIAILAILATVSVVGYTSFIERANVSNDENIAAQLNQFLTALKADSRGEFYDDIKENGIHEDNVWEITQYILYDCGLEGKLEPQAGKYDHHFYFDFETQEYVVLSDEKAIDPNSGFENLWELLIGAETPETKYNVRPGNFFTANNQYFLVDTTGALAEVVNSFYTFNGTGDDLKTLFDKASKIKNADGDTVDALLNMIKETVFVTTSGNLVYDLTTDHKYIFIDENVTVIPNIKTDKDGRPQVISSENPLIKTGEKVTIALPENVTLYGDSLNIDVLDGGDVVVSIDAKNWNDVIDLVDANFTNNDVTVELNGAKYKVNEYIVNTTRVNESGKLEATEDIATVLKYKYRLDSFNAGIVDNNDNKVHNVPVEKPGNANNTTGYSAWEKGEFYLDITSALGTGEDKSIISTYDVEWALGTITWQAEGIVDYGIGASNDGKTYITVSPDGKVELADGLAPKINEFTVTATATVDRNGYVKGFHAEYDANNAAQQTVTVKVVRVKTASFTLAGNALMDGKNAVLIHGAEANDHSAVLTKVNYVNELSEIVLSDSLTLANVGTPVGFSVVNNKVQTSALAEDVEEGAGSITITIGDHAQYTAGIVTYDASKLPLQPKFTANRAGNEANVIFNMHVGNEGYVSIADLFSGDIPEGAVLKAWSVVPEDSKYMSSTDRTPMFTKAEADAEGITAECYANYVSSDNVVNYQQIDFDGTREGIVYLAVYVNGVRVSGDIKVYVVDGTNVRNYAELTAGIAKGAVLLNDILDMTAGGSVTVPTNKTLYGNLHTFDISNGVESGVYGIVVLSSDSTMRDLRVVGRVYPSVTLSGGEQYGTNAVDAYAGAEINNCYIANCRSPLIINGVNGTYTEPVVLKNSVIFGGAYANIDIRHGSLKIEGDVTTVQQPMLSIDGTTTVMGIGVAAWFEDDQKELIIDDEAEFKQYNFMNSDLSEHLKPLKYSGVTMLELNEPFNKLFTTEYTAHHFVDSNNATKPYINSGIVSVDKYFFGTSVSGLASQLVPPGNKKNDQITVKLVVPEGIDLTGEKIDLLYDNSKYNDPNGDTDGVIEQLDAITLINDGYTFKCKADTYEVKWYGPIPTYLPRNIYTEYDFYFAYTVEPDPDNDGQTKASNKYNNLIVTGDKYYDSPSYAFDLSSSFEAMALGNIVVDVNFHNSGLHYTKMPTEIWTPDKANHEEWFIDYLEMSNSNHANYNYYVPTNADGTEKYDFNANGVLPDFPQ